MGFILFSWALKLRASIKFMTVDKFVGVLVILINTR